VLYYIRRLKKVRSILGAEIASNLASAFVLNRLVYCNTVFTNLLAYTIAPLQRVQNVAVQLVKDRRLQNHMTSALRYLHWLPLHRRTTYKLCVLRHLVHTGNSLSYLSNVVTT